MTKKTDKSQDKKTKASATELEEKDLDEVQGGASYIKFDGVDGESLTRSTDYLKVGDIDGESKLTTDYLKLGDIKGESLKR